MSDDSPFSGYHSPRRLALTNRVGAGPAALEAMERVVERGFYCPAALKDDPWVETLRAEPGFGALLRRAEEGRRTALSAYREAGGEKLLGVDEV